MRAVIDFINGLTIGLGRQHPGPGVRKGGGASGSGGAIVKRLSLFVGGLCCVGALFFSGRATPQKKEPSALVSPHEFKVNLENVLTFDSAAKPRQWKHIVIHHSASKRGNAQSFDASHRERGWRSLGYHFVIGNGVDQGDGVVVAGPRWYSQEAGAHANATEYNEHGIGICLVGNFNEQPPTPNQWAALRELSKVLCKRYGISPAEILGHKHVRRGGSTECPGRLLVLERLREEMQ